MPRRYVETRVSSHTPLGVTRTRTASAAHLCSAVPPESAPIIRLQAVQNVQQLVDFAKSRARLETVPSATVRSWLHAFARITEPEIQSELITLRSSGGGVSRKPGNIVLNWRRLFDVGPDAAIAASAYASSTPFLRGLIGLYVWNKVWRGSEEALSDVEASVIETLWLRYGKDRRVPGDAAFDSVNEARRDCELTALTRPEFERAVDRLAAMSCLELSDGNIWLQEWVRRAT